jgi:hypothetical protein
MNTYACDQCNWRYNWRMGDRVRAVTRHQLAHLVDQPVNMESRKRTAPINELVHFVHERIENTQLV